MQCIKKWREYIFILEKQLLTSKEFVSSLQKQKDKVQRNFEKVEGQVKDRLFLITKGEEKLYLLQLQLDDHNYNVRNLCS